VDNMIWLFGLPQAVNCQMQNHYFEEYTQFGTEDIATLWCEYPEFTATLTVGRSKAREKDGMFNSMNVTGNGTWVQLDRVGYQVNGEPVDTPTLSATGTEGCVGHLIACIENDEAPTTSAQDGFDVALVTTAAYQSAHLGRRIALPLEDENHPLISVEDQVIDRFLD